MLKDYALKPHPLQMSAPLYRVVLPLSAAERGYISFKLLEKL
jgi:hypothetical protein